jgi:hypothetical protein
LRFEAINPLTNSTALLLEGSYGPDVPESHPATQGHIMLFSVPLPFSA